MLAYVFWHQPRAAVERSAYEEAQRAFHAALEATSACFRIAELPFKRQESGYEDWYLAEDWEALGELNQRAVDTTMKAEHDRAAAGAGEGWGGVYSLLRGAASIPLGTRWCNKSPGEPAERFLASLPEAGIWRRQMVLGPAPEFCAASPESASRVRIWPADA